MPTPLETAIAEYGLARVVLYTASEERDRLCRAHTRRDDLIQAQNVIIAAARGDVQLKRTAVAVLLP